jgi:hypothetical protein
MEDSAMNARKRLSAFFFTILCTFVFLPRYARAETPDDPAPQSPAARSSAPASSDTPEEVTIPGPLRSFLRMAAISQKISPEEVLPLLARNVVVNGFQGGGGKPTEYLILLNWYMDQARELMAFAGPGGVIQISDCAGAKPLLPILGYRMKESCGPNAALETTNADRAFLTIDSGFPLSELEETLRGGKPFSYPFASTRVPVLFGGNEWVVAEKNEGKNGKKDLVDALLRDPGMARLYWAMSRMDSETRSSLWQSQGLKKLVPAAAVLDFYGSHISIRAGKVVVPGGPKAESEWKDLVGVSPTSAGEFVIRLLTRDDGWLAAYFDALSRVSQKQQPYFTESHHLHNFYEALRGKDLSPSPTRHSFRPDQGLFLLVNRLQLEANGQPHIPGGLDVWKEAMRAKSDSKIVRDWGKRAGGWNNPDQVVEGMVAVSRVSSREGPLNAFLALTEIDRNRAPEQRLNPATARLLIDKFDRFGDQYLLFSEFPGLSNASITRFFNVAEGLNKIPDRLVRADALGILQANIGLWQILARQGQIPEASVNDSWMKVLNPFGNAINSSGPLFEAGRSSLGELVRAATGKPGITQDEMIALLAGPAQSSPEGQQVRQELANKMRLVLDDQRLVSLDTLLALGDGLNQMAKGKGANESLVPLAGELREFEMPKPLFTTRERSEYAAGLYSNRHTILQMRTDLTKVLKAQGASSAEIAEARGQLTPFFRDTLVGLNYAYYEPSGAQMLHNNPLFVRSHDFSGGDYSGETATAGEQTWRTARLFGRGWTASGGAHLIGSMADLPYVLAKVEQDFIVPKNVQSLIWEDLVPGLMTSAILPRWWGVTRNELHAVTLYQRTGEELLEAAAENEKVRQTVMGILSDRMLPQRSEEVEKALREGHAQEALAQTAPAETFYLTAEFRRRSPGDTSHWGAAGKELEALTVRYPTEVSVERISEDFGVPHPALAQSYALELLNVKPFPSFLGYSSRLLAESWDSNNLYWARLADEMNYSPVMLNRLVPELTRRMVEQTFATHLEDWPAVLRAMRETGDEFRQGKIAALPKNTVASGL